MTDVMQYERPAESELEQWARDAHQVALVAVNLAKTAFVPQSFNRDAAQVTAAILTGREVGLPPMASLRSIDIIQGTPALRAFALRGLAQSAGHEVWVEESTATRAIVCGQRRGTEHVERVVWTIERARQMGLTGKDNWKRMPQDMLLARATSALVRLIAADAVMGIPYSIEELEDGADRLEATESEVKPVKRTVKRAPLKVAEPEPEQPQLAPGELPDESPMVLDPIDDWEAQERAQADAYLAEQHENGEQA